MARAELQQVKDDPFATPEAKIKELRKQRDPKLGQIAVNRYDFIDALIAAYDETGAALVETRAALARANASASQSLSEVTAARDRIVEELRQVSEDRAQLFLNNQELEANMKMVHDKNVELATENESLRGQATGIGITGANPSGGQGGIPGNS